MTLDTSKLKEFNRLYPMFIQKYEQFIPSDDSTIIEKINSVIDQLNRVGKLTNDVVKDWNSIYQWLMNDGLTENVYAKLDTMVAEGFFDTFINDVIFVDFNNRLDGFDSHLADIVCNINSNKDVDKTGVTDITAILNQVILDLCKKTNGQKKITFNGLYKITGTVYLPSNVVLDLNGSTLVGNGYNTNTLFKSGIFTGTNVKEYDDSSFVTSLERAGVINGTIKDCGKAFDIIKMNLNCNFHNLYFINCEQAINAVRCYYASFKKLSYRSTDWTTKDASTNPAFNFQTENNVMEIKHITVQSRKLGIQVYDITSGLNIDTCSFENCDVGFKELGNDIRNLTLKNCYVENCTTGLQLTLNTEVDNCFFNNCTHAIESSLGNKIKENNQFLNCIVKVFNTQSPNAGSDVIELPLAVTYDASPNLTVGSDMTQGAFAQIKQRNVQVYSGDPSKSVINNILKNQIIDFSYAGKNGYISNTLPFCSHDKTAGTTFNIVIDTSISYEPYSFLGYHFKVTDNDSVWNLYGTIFGDTADKRDGTNKGITLSNNNGMLRITLSQFTHPSNFYAIEGIVRHL